TKVLVPDEKGAAIKTIKEWLDSRGLDNELRNETLVIRRGGVPINISAIVYKGELDRLRVLAFYTPKDQPKGSKEFEALAMKLNKAQNFLQVFVDGDGDLIAAGNITFFDELTARVFDAYIELFVAVIKQNILTPEAVKMLK